MAFSVEWESYFLELLESGFLNCLESFLLHSLESRFLMVGWGTS